MHATLSDSLCALFSLVSCSLDLVVFGLSVSACLPSARFLAMYPIGSYQHLHCVCILSRIFALCYSLGLIGGGQSFLWLRFRFCLKVFLRQVRLAPFIARKMDHLRFSLFTGARMNAPAFRHYPSLREVPWRVPTFSSAK